MDDIYNRLFTSTPTLAIDFGDILKLPLVLFLIANIFYSLMLVLKVKILADTVDSENNGKVKIFVYTNLVISLITTLLASILILLG
jgi:hypothetical protein